MVFVFLNDDKTVHSVATDFEEQVYVVHRNFEFFESVMLHRVSFAEADKIQRQTLECRSKQIQSTINHIQKGT